MATLALIWPPSALKQHCSRCVWVCVGVRGCACMLCACVIGVLVSRVVPIRLLADIQIADMLEEKSADNHNRSDIHMH